MIKCLSFEQMYQFLGTITAEFTHVGSSLIIHAEVGDVFYLWNGAAFCMSGGMM